jgi:ABC-2 type transport system permease protein
VRIFIAGVRKLIRRPATWVTLVLLIALLVLILLAVGASARQIPDQSDARDALLLVTFPVAYYLVLSFILGLGGLLAVIYGAAIAGSEWQWGTLKSAVARGEGRSWYVLLSFASIALMVGVGLVLAFVAGVFAALLSATIADVPTDGIGDLATLRALPEQLGRGWIAVTEEAALGFAIATIAKSQLAGVGAGIGLYFAESFASIFLPDIVKYLPFNAAQAVVSTAGLAGGGRAARVLDPNTALLVVLVWLAGSLIVAALVTERAEIGG